MITIEEFKERFNEIKNLGWIRTHRAGTTGIGKTLEDLLGIDENNIQGPDFGQYELKSMRKNANSMLTLITKSPDEPAGANTQLRLNYGYSSSAYDNDEKVLHSTLSATRFTPIANTGHSLKVSCTEERINIINENYEVVASWLIDNLKAVMDRKLSDQFVFVRASSRGTGVNEEFLYEEAYLLDGFNSQSIIDLINEGQIFVDLRIGQYHSGPNRGKTHDHGTGFRIFERSHYLIFNIRRIA
ncbi:MAG: glycosyl hydrolase [Clostridia bacterium]|nr:glycosyl hydrolase [Clostridia bacterium]